MLFPNVTENVDINKNSCIKDEANESTDTFEKAVSKYVII